MEKSKIYICIFIMVMMLSSTLAYAILQSFPPPPQVTLPEKNIIDYKLSSEQESILLERGNTILEFSYSLACDNCLEQKSYLENLANQFSGQIFLQKIQTDTAVPKLKIKSLLGEKRLVNTTSEEIVDALCELMLKPPVICALR